MDALAGVNSEEVKSVATHALVSTVLLPQVALDGAVALIVKSRDVPLAIFAVPDVARNQTSFAGTVASVELVAALHPEGGVAEFAVQPVGRTTLMEPIETLVQFVAVFVNRMVKFPVPPGAIVSWLVVLAVYVLLH